MGLTQELAHAVAQVVLLIEGVVARCVLYVRVQLENVAHLQHKKAILIASHLIGQGTQSLTKSLSYVHQLAAITLMCRTHNLAPWMRTSLG